MSLDIYFVTGEPRIEKCRHCDGTGEINHGRASVFDANITHNLVPMWKEAGVCEALYESEGKTAGEIVETLRVGLRAMLANPDPVQSA